MTEASTQDLNFCFEKALEGDAWFRVHVAFAPKSRASQIAALYALFALLERPLLAGDQEVAVAQLAWWREELSSDQILVSAHPVLRLLREVSPPEMLAGAALQHLATRVFELMQCQPISGQGDFANICNAIGETRTRAELALAGDEAGFDAFKKRCSGTGIACVMSLARRNIALLAGLFPLEILASSQASIGSIEDGSAKSRAALDQLRTLGESWIEDQRGALEGAVRAREISAESGIHLAAAIECQRLNFLRVVGALKRGRAARKRVLWHPADAMRVWWRCRGVSRLRSAL